MRFKILFVFLIVCINVNLIIPQSYASDIVEFGPQEAEITGSIKYTVIGRYKSQFDEFKGEIRINDKTNEINSVYLEIEAGTINSNCKWCDKIVRSKQLLHAEKYPKIIFKSSEIVKTLDGYNVSGILDMHGVTKEITFPFEYEITKDNQRDGKFLSISGKWLIKRKDFNIVWNKFLDKGGVLVGNFITVDWGIKSSISTI